MAESTSLSALRRQIETLGGGSAGEAGTRFATGHEGVDAALGGGLARGKVHELFGAQIGDSSSATGFALLLASLAGGANGGGTGKVGGGGTPLLWLRTDGGVRRGGGAYGPGLADLGIAPARMLLASLPDEMTVLRAAVDALRCPALGAVVIECWGNPAMLDLTATRRLTLAAEAHGVTAILLRLDARQAPSAVETRWSIAAAPSVPLPANAPGQTAFDIVLLRRRAGSDGLAWRVEWNRDRSCFAEPALPGALVPLPAAGSPADVPAESVGAHG